MKIKSFKLSNFKSFKDTNNEVIELNDINFIYGQNNSGKSNILKFLNIIFKNKYQTTNVSTDTGINTLRDYGSFSEGVINNEPFIYHMNRRKQDIKFDFLISVTKLELQLADIDAYVDLNNEYFNPANDEIEIKFNGRIYSADNVTSYIELEKALIEGQVAFSIENNIKIYFKDKKALVGNSNVFNKLLSYFNDCILYIDNNRYFLNEQYESIKGDLEPHNFKNWLYNLSLDNYSFDLYEELLNFIRINHVGKLVDLQKLDLTFSIDLNNNLELMLNKGEARLPITSFGTGISQILYILTKIFITKSRIIIIEELELNLSPNIQKEFFKILRKLILNNAIDQVLFTSHSPFFNFRTDFSTYEVTIDTNKVSSINKKAVRSTTQEKFWRNQITN